MKNKITVKMLEKALTKENFKEYLHRFSDKIKVGIVNNVCNCPISKYMYSVFKYFDVKLQVRTSHSFCGLYDELADILDVTVIEIECPKWVRKFVKNIDNLEQHSVSDKTALKILHEI